MTEPPGLGYTAFSLIALLDRYLIATGKNRRPETDAEKDGSHMGRKRDDPAAHYQIAVEGELDAGWADSFSGMSLSFESHDGLSVSTLTGPVTDQAALRGMICKLWDLNLTLISVQRTPSLKTDQGGMQDA
jgi:hypothetical protein